MGRLFWKFFFAFWLALLTAGVGVGTLVWLRQQATESTVSLVDVHGRARLLVSAAQATLLHGGTPALRGLMAEWDREPIPRIYAVDESNREILDRAVAPALLEQARLIAREGTHPQEVREIKGDDSHRYLLFVPFHERNLSDRRPSLRGDGRPSRHRAPPPPILQIVAGILASVLFSAWLAWYLAKPIGTLRKAFDDLAQGKLDTRVGHLMGKRRDELTDLGREFDHMAGQIGSLMSAQRSLLHDVSHELRSPLARLQAAIGLARQQPEKAAITLERIEHESQRLNDLVGQLLTLSRLEAGVPGAIDAEIDIGELLVDIVGDARFEAQAKGVRVEFVDPGEIVIRGRAELIHRALDNVIRNAVQHTPKAGAVTVDTLLDDHAHCLHISVSDQGSGVPETQLSAIFEPFFRGDNRQGQEGVGLGLAIARRAAEAHGGRIKARNHPGGGLSVQLDLPILRRRQNGRPRA